MWETILEHVQDWAPSVIATSVGLVVMISASRIMRRRRNTKIDSAAGVIGPLLSGSILAITLIAIALTLPISESARGQLLGLLGLLVTGAIALSSTTFLGNAMAGIMLRAIGSFRPGDYVRVGDHLGRVSDKGLLHTEIQTEDRDLTTLPNLYLITHPLTVLRSSGTVVSATISLGYDVPHVLVEQHLIEAATRAGLTDPFVQLLELGDHAISYRAAGFLTELKHLLTTRSRLRKTMLDCLHEAKIEIVSPGYINLRSLSDKVAILPEEVKVPPVVVEQDPEARIFDKAYAAEAKARVEAEIEEQEARIAELHGKLDDSDFVAEKVALESEIAAAKVRQKALKALLSESEPEA